MVDNAGGVDKSMRSVFVGNIPYEVTEEKLREIFSQVGPVMTFKLMFDRETGKPKGYGFCEYKDQETALSAMRNLNGYEIGGRPLRVDNACTEKTRMEMQSLMMGSVVESPYGSEVDPNKAPEAISNAVASLPPEQMYELMRQMKLCVRNNPNEARTMLMNNPQLAYALLQAQVVMRIIDPKMAVQILHEGRDALEPLLLTPVGGGSMSGGPVLNGGPPSHGLPLSGGGQPQGGIVPRFPPPGPPPSAVAPQVFAPPPRPVPPPSGPYGGDFDMRQVGPPPRGPDQDMRLPPSNMAQPPLEFDSRFGRDPRAGEFDPRYRDQPPPMRDPRDARDPRAGGNFSRDPRATVDTRPDPRDRDYRNSQSNNDSRDPRGRPVATPQDKDFRMSAATGPRAGGVATNNLPAGLAGQDQEKAGLIMQVLQLSDEQIRLLPPDQRQSIMQLKEQIQRTQH